MIQVCCNKCKGTGKINLAADLEKTLRRLREVGISSAKDIHGYLDEKDIGITAVNNRLERLCAMGLATRHVKGERNVTYKAVPRHKLDRK